MAESSWDQTLKQHLAALIAPESAEKMAKGSLWEPFWSCAPKPEGPSILEEAAPVRHKLPRFFNDKSWDLGREAIQEPFDPAQTSRPDVKVPSFFLNKTWDLSDAASTLGMKAETPKADEGITDSRFRRLSFGLQPCGARFGMVLEETLEPLPGGLLVVTSIDEASSFAKTASGGSGIRAGDVIVAVNGRQGAPAEMRELLLKEVTASGIRSITLVVRSRPGIFEIELRREGNHWNKLGVAAGADDANPDCLVVNNIHAEGLIPAWNAAHGSLRICKKDLITHVNGISQDAAAMKKEIQQCSTKGAKLRFRIVTPAGQGVACHEEPLVVQDLPCAHTTVPWDMQVRWLDDNMSEASTACGASLSSGTRTPDESCSGTRTPTEVCV
jgi:hypothetical protein